MFKNKKCLNLEPDSGPNFFLHPLHEVLFVPEAPSSSSTCLRVFCTGLSSPAQPQNTAKRPGAAHRLVPRKNVDMGTCTWGARDRERRAQHNKVVTDTVFIGTTTTGSSLVEYTVDKVVTEKVGEPCLSLVCP